MLKFITRFFAIIGFLVVLVIGLFVLLAHNGVYSESEPNEVILTLDFTHPIVEQSDTSPFDLALDDKPGVLLDMLRAIDRAAKDPHVKGIVARFGTQQPSLAKAEEIRAALQHFRESGKFTYAFGTDFGEFGLGNRAYYLASAFDNIWLQPVGTVSLTGVALQSPFGKTALEKIGITADFMQREEYKSFMEMGQRDDFSPLVKAEMRGMVDNLSDQIAEGISESRKWDIGHVKDLMARGPYTDEEALQEGLVTKLAYADQFNEEIDRKAGKDAKQASVEDYIGYARPKEKDAKTTKIALIYGAGMIVDRSSGGGDLASDHVMGADEIAGAFDDAADDEDIKAILFRIDSPGGSPAASETIRHAMVHAQAKGKPVIVSMGDTAASGGYWVAMNGDKIIADPATLTGSIGVVAGKFAAAGLLQKLGISMDGVSTSENAGMWNMSEGFTPVQRARVNALLDNTYHAFVSNVSTARKIPMEKMPDIAKGRVFTGEQAVKIGLVDALGGYEVALASVRKSLKLEENALLAINILPTPPSPGARLMKLMRHLGAEEALISNSAASIRQMQVLVQPWMGAFASFQKPVSARMMDLSLSR